jgi:hypothetical protein
MENERGSYFASGAVVTKSVSFVSYEWAQKAGVFFFLAGFPTLSVVYE